MLLVITLQVNVNAININNADCDQIVQCDAYGYAWSGSDLVCDTSTQNSPDTEEVMTTYARIADYCNVGDSSSDCIDIGFDFYEELSDNNIYHGNGYDRFGGISVCCDYGDTTVWSYGFINDFNSDRQNPISREWSIIDSSDPGRYFFTFI